MSRLIDLKRMGGIVTKSVTLRPTKGLPTPRMAETASGMLNAIGLQNSGVEEFMAKDDAPWIAEAGVPVFVSIAGTSVEEYSRLIVMVREIPGVVGIEANISCPNVERRNQVFACHPDQAAEVVGAVSRLTRLPVFAKLTADVTNITEVAEACVRAGAHGLSLINTLLGMAIDTETFRPKLGAVTGGLSGPAMRPIAVRCVYQVSAGLPRRADHGDRRRGHSRGRRRAHAGRRVGGPGRDRELRPARCDDQGCRRDRQDPRAKGTVEPARPHRKGESRSHRPGTRSSWRLTSRIWTKPSGWPATSPASCRTSRSASSCSRRPVRRRSNASWRTRRCSST